MLRITTSHNNKSSEMRPHRRHARIVQSYSSGGADVYLHLIMVSWARTSLLPPTRDQTASRSVQPFLQGSPAYRTHGEARRHRDDGKCCQSRTFRAAPAATVCHACDVDEIIPLISLGCQTWPDRIQSVLPLGESL